jgi:RNA polymerase sigma factor (sigma-70 family)
MRVSCRQLTNRSDLPREKQLLESALLVVRWQQGDRSAFEGIVKLWERSLFYYLRRLAPSEADAWEILQETWLKLFRSLRTIRDPRALPGFLYQTARNTAISRLKRPNVLELDLDADRICDDREVEPTVDGFEAERVHDALAHLPLLQREALTLFFLQDLSLDEIALLLGIPKGTVKSRIHYAKQSLRTILSQGDHDVGTE